MLPINKFTGFTSKVIQTNEAKPEEKQSVATPPIVQGIAASKDVFEVAATKTNDLSSFLQPKPCQILKEKPVVSSVFDSYGSEILGKVGISPSMNTLTNTPVGNTIEEISSFTGLPVDQLQAIFTKNGLKPGQLPYPPDERVVAFLKDNAFASQNEVDLLWKIYKNFENVNQQPGSNPLIDSKSNMMSPLLEAIIPNVQGVRNAAAAQAKYQEISDFIGKPPAEVQDLFQKYHLKPYSLPQPPDYNVLAFLKDPAFSAVSPSLVLYMTYGW